MLLRRAAAIVHAIALVSTASTASATGLWDWPHRGDVRAALTVGADLAGATLAATIVWRRRDAHPEQKRVLVTDANDVPLSGAAWGGAPWGERTR